MPRRCIAAGCSTASGEGYSLHEFPRDDSLRAKWTRAVKLQRAKFSQEISQNQNLAKKLSIMLKNAGG